ncbi:bacillithiol system redox-active protein YtxJ [Virgibacillus alimentarius]|uniref:Bacillithiol system protein YtxJ n=1 Tax=Virgibacillus alimentarius TaxID=698769 RepID=A0ABS4S8F9_9BACI|nr:MULTISPECIES: bacillithiol system redox-active protein YtxJ [Virgibacillus]MBP2257164.1 bacillithiol system protein YtxJ [Virgibacillus alimentarius]HLR69393.1 bacillithiol system redox-active protein YtxJ [Virgibacillus sp.]
MAELKKIHSNEDMNEVWERSEQKPAILFKHSATCPVSANAFNELNAFWKTTQEDVDCSYLVVSESRDLSNQIAEETEVKHESPQIFLISNKNVIWHTSHSKISQESINEALKNVK